MSDIQAQTDLTFVRQEIAASEPPPRSMVGPIGWMRRNLFASVGDTLLTIVGLLLVLYFLPPLLSWAFFDAVWDGSNRDVCISPDAGACWAFIKAKFPQFIYGRYPLGERWRVDIVFFLLAAGILPMAIPSVPYKALNGIFLVGIFPVIAFILLAGGHITFSPLVGAVVYLVLLAAVLALAIRLVRARPDDIWLRMALGLLLAFAAISVLAYVVQGVVFGSSVPDWAMFTLLVLKAVCLLALIILFIVLILVPNGLPAARALATSIGPVLLAAVLLEVMQADFGLAPVETPLWGGLLVTLVVSYVGIVASLPLGILLALGRRSKMPIVRTFCIAFIELWRGVPLITVLFMASVMLPLFLPPGANFDKLMRALIGVALFASAYMAEVVRGGLQAIPKGQYEAAHALGLGYWQTMRLIILPQALKMVIPGIVNTFIGLFKDTSLVYIIGLFDLLGIVRLNFTDTNWASWQTPATGLVFAAFIFWLFCFGMSRYSQFMERRLNTGHKR